MKDRKKIQSKLPKYIAFFAGYFAICFFFIASLSYSSTIASRLEAARKMAVSDNFEGALEIYNFLIKQDPENVEALNGKARVISWMGKLDDAVIVYRQALSLAPHNLDSLTGLADVYAWKGNYDTGVGLLTDALEQYPDERELLIRIARYKLWAKKKGAARHYAETVLIKHPGDKDAIDILKQARQIFEYEYYLGYYFLNINDTSYGHNFYTGLRYEPSDRYRLFGQLDYLDRFNQQEGRILSGGSVKLNQNLRLSGIVGFAPDAIIYPLYAGSAELAYSFIFPLVIYGGISASKFDAAEFYGVSAAGEFYPYGNVSLLSRVTVSTTDFHEGRRGTDASLFLKATRFLNDTDNLFAYFAYGDESYLNTTIDQIGDIEAKIVGIGGTFFMTPSVGLSPSFEYQDRERGVRYLQFGLELKFRL